MSDRLISAEMDSKLKLAARCLHVNQAAYAAAKEEVALCKKDMDQAQEVLNELIDDLYPNTDPAPLFGGGTEDTAHE